MKSLKVVFFSHMAGKEKSRRNRRICQKEQKQRMQTAGQRQGKGKEKAEEKERKWRGKEKTARDIQKADR